MTDKELQEIKNRLNSGYTSNSQKLIGDIGYCISDVKLLIAEIEQLREQNRWIPVSERLPKFDSNCLVITEKGEIFTSKFYGYGEECQGYKEFPEGVWEIDACEETVIAWRELPEPCKKR